MLAAHFRAASTTKLNSNMLVDIVAATNTQPPPRAARQNRQQGLAYFLVLTHRTTALMILTQVHLRKPCYDFYFL